MWCPSHLARLVVKGVGMGKAQVHGTNSFCQASALFALDSVVLLETGPGWLLKPRECKVNVVKDGRKNIVMVETISQIRRNCFTRAVGKNEYKHTKSVCHGHCND